MTTPAIDAVVHPFPRRPDDLREYMASPWRLTRSLPLPQRYVFPAPTGAPPYGEWVASSRTGSGHPGSDPAAVRAHLDASGTERAILMPLTRGLLPDVGLGAAVCAATNDWLADSWLGESNADGRFLGSIRLDPREPTLAIAELQRWASDPRMVQVAVPMEAHQPYGQRRYLPLWEAVADAGLPMAICADGGCGADFFPTANGYPHTFAEFASLSPLNFFYHLTSFIAEGVFERVPKLRVMFADGGHDVLMPLMWRMDMDWPIVRRETPWVERVPSEYLEPHVRFATSRLEGPGDSLVSRRWAEHAGADTLLIYGSHYPQWRSAATPGSLASIDDVLGKRVYTQNAVDFYRLASGVRS